MFSFFKSNAQNVFLGAYSKPEMVKQLESIQKHDGSWESLGFYIEFNHHYSTTPLDVIPFAGTGGDGIHFGFLTDFGNVKDLDKAPIVCVSPMNDPPVKLVSQNLRDFLRLVITVGNAEFLNEDYANKEEVTIRLMKWDKVSEVDGYGHPLPPDKIFQMKQRITETLKARVEKINLIKSQFQMEEMPDVYKYIKDLRLARQAEITIETADNIGIIYLEETMPITEFDYRIKDSDSVSGYLEKASKAQRLKFYRDATYHYILSKDYDYDIQKVIIKALRNDGFKREAHILETKYL